MNAPSRVSAPAGSAAAACERGQLHPLTAMLADAWVGLVSRPGRTAAAFGVIAAGAAALSLLLAVLGGLRERIGRLTGELGLDTVALLSSSTGAEKDAPRVYPLTRRHADRLRANLGPTEVSGVRYAEARDANDGIVRVLYTDEWLAHVRGWGMAEGRFLDRADTVGGSRSVVATERQAFVAGWRVGETVRLDGLLFRLAGIVRVDEEDLSAADAGGRIAVGDRAVFLPASSLERDERLDVLFVRTPGSSRGRAGAILRRITEQPDFDAGPLHWVTPGSLTAALRRTESSVRVLSAVATAFALWLGGAMLSGLWFMNVRERIPEIGLRRALGGGRRSVGWLFVTEAVLISLAGGLVGTALGQAAIRWIPGGIPLMFRPGGLGLWLPPAVSLLAGSIFAWAPARLASRIEPAEALRSD